MLEKLKGANYHDLEDLVYRMELKNDEMMYTLDKKLFSSEKTGCTLPTRISEVCDINKTLPFC